MGRKKLYKAYYRKYNKEHRVEKDDALERFLERNEDYYKIYYENHKEELKQRQKEYYEANKDKIRVKYRKQRNDWRKRKVEQLRKQGVTNPWCVIRGMEPRYAILDTNSIEAE